jgi:hypothetical protein
MKKSKYTEEQIAFALRQAQTGTRVEEICRKFGISQATFYNWKKKYGGLRPAARHLKIKYSYLGSLLDGTKKNPGDWYLRKLGLRRVTYIEEI